MTNLLRRDFLKSSAALAAGTLFTDRSLWAKAHPGKTAPRFMTSDHGLQKTYNHAMKMLSQNILRLPGSPEPVLIEGAVYKGIWLECGPQEGLVYNFFNPAIGQANHNIFFALQRNDGYLPCSVKSAGPGMAQIQTAVPIAATAWDVYLQTRNAAFLERAYKACSRWDDWLMKYRNTRGTGLTEGFCTYDTGHDNSPRWKDMPRRSGVNAQGEHDARVVPKAPGLPRLCPDLSAATYGGRVALAKMAKELNQPSEAADWLQKAATIRKLILEKLYDPETACFYDLDSNNKFVKIRGDLLTRVLGEHVLDRVRDQQTFDAIYEKQIHNPAAFWAPYPLPSIALNDPTFVRPIPRNSWGGATQALTALRAPRWMDYYNKQADMAHMQQQWVKAIVRADGFYQQMDPVSGEFTITDGSGYSPAALVLLDSVWRLYGVRPVYQDNGRMLLEWNCRKPANGLACNAYFYTQKGSAILSRTGDRTTLSLDEKQLMTVQGTVRLVTDEKGQLKHLVGTAQEKSEIRIVWPDGRVLVQSIRPNTMFSL
ncbi:MAG: MGH1-like glycoside hydrolase domain-containing protein [Acidobacteriaceae bacterium]